MFTSISKSIKVLMAPINVMPLVAPFSHTFAFGILDDTDYARYEYIRPIYDYLASMGVKTTKTTWSLSTAGHYGKRSDTLERKDYANYLRQLQIHGFEMALHNVAGESSTRDATLRGYSIFKEMFGAYPILNAPHAYNLENNSMLDARSSYYWGDLLGESGTLFWRVNAFNPDPNTLNRFPLKLTLGKAGLSPRTPTGGCEPLATLAYAVKEGTRRSLVQSREHTGTKHYLFWTSYGSHAKDFLLMLSQPGINKLQLEGGLCIVSTHLSCGFCEVRDKTGWTHATPYVVGTKGWTETGWDPRREYRPLPAFVQTIENIVSAGGWCAPVSSILRRYLQVSSIAIKPSFTEISVSNEGGLLVEGLALRLDERLPIAALRVGDKHLCYLGEHNQFFLPPLLPRSTLRVEVELGPWRPGIPRVHPSADCILSEAIFDEEGLRLQVQRSGTLTVSRPASLLRLERQSSTDSIGEWTPNMLIFEAMPESQYLVRCRSTTAKQNRPAVASNNRSSETAEVRPRRGEPVEEQ